MVGDMLLIGLGRCGIVWCGFVDICAIWGYPNTVIASSLHILVLTEEGTTFVNNYAVDIVWTVYLTLNNREKGK